YRTQIAGYVKQFTYGPASIDLLTVKGAGHLVPSDRPGPALQMFENFLRGQDYSKELPFSFQLHPLKQEYQIQETVTGERTGVPVPGSVSTRKLKLKSRRMSKNKSTAPRERLASAPLDPPPIGSKQDDLITDLPGLTWTPNFNHYSGYLAASPGNYLHYW
ncbi:hypothetical protein ANCDUO_27809, partial [Ancylostoma duodenale]